MNNQTDGAERYRLVLFVFDYLLAVTRVELAGLAVVAAVVVAAVMVVTLRRREIRPPLAPAIRASCGLAANPPVRPLRQPLRPIFA